MLYIGQYSPRHSSEVCFECEAIMRFPEVVLASAAKGLIVVLLSLLLAFIVAKKGG